VGIARALDVTERFRNALSLFSTFIFHFRMRKNENSNVVRAGARFRNEQSSILQGRGRRAAFLSGRLILGNGV
jgi:hypothetical protein